MIERIFHNTLQVLPDYEHAHDLVVTDTDNIVQSTKLLVREMNQGQLTELRAISKPSQELEDIFAAIIMIGEFWGAHVIVDTYVHNPKKN